jgi:hypothetical protein
MSKCEECGRELALPFICAYCGGYYCDEHRLPESHECSNQPTVAPPFARPQTPSKSETKVSPYGYAKPTERPENMEKPRARRHFPVWKVVGLILVVVIIGAFTLYYAPTVLSYFQNSLNSSSSSSPSQNQEPHLGTEIKNYPIDGLSFTVTDWTFTTVEAIDSAKILGLIGLPEPQSGSVYVLVNFTLRNIGDMEINFQAYDTYYKLGAVTTPSLQYGNYYAQANPTNFLTGYAGYYLGQSTDLMPNQTTKCALVYEILEGYTPSRLLYPNKDSPTLVINLSN